MQIPDGSFAIVFESGVFRFDEEGAVHVHVSHSADAPHPLKTHPDGRDTTVPEDVEDGVVEGTGSGPFTGMASEAAELPEGLVLTVKGFSICRVESSGDLSMLVPNATAWPEWFTEGKIHRFDGPDGRPRIWAQSAKPPKPDVAPRRQPVRMDPKPTEEAAKGCLPALMGVVLGGWASGWFS